MTIASFKDKQDDLVINPGNLAVIAAKYGTTVPTKLGAPGGGLIALPVGWEPLGEVAKKDGAKITPDVKTAEIEGYGSPTPRRVLRTAESVTVSFTAQEARRVNVEMFWNAELGSTVADADGEWQIKKSAADGLLNNYYSIILVGQDTNTAGLVFPYYIFPKVSVTKTDAQSFDMEAELAYPLTFTAYEDPVFGGYMAHGSAGAGQAAVNTLAGFSAGS